VREKKERARGRGGTWGEGITGRIQVGVKQKRTRMKKPGASDTKFVKECEGGWGGRRGLSWGQGCGLGGNWETSRE